ncbi:hypothetical protein HCH_04400 [Hahella chejuensis KCTC 2396]|uniref:Transposase and inactivated derivatives n=1 Tax=Hahella chejuensis (strain KCTC 2396) TaxID=349521 RepID=Q2SE20_HAHCH|nr:hypothetical protein HCH_04400 [Hahella chejuensis KCTC 2396]
MKDLQSWEDAGEIELYYFDESGFSQRSLNRITYIERPSR